MNRRTYIKSLGATGSTIAIAGCSGDSGNTVVSETVYGTNQQYNFEVDSEQTISVYINHIEGSQTVVFLMDPDNNEIDTFSTETETTGTHEAEKTGVYSVSISTLGEAEVEITLED